MVVLVTGANGLLGSVIVDSLRERGRDVVGTYHSERPKFDDPVVQLDIGDIKDVSMLLKEYSVETVINCAAFTDVDACESNAEIADEVNAVAPGRIAHLCSEREVDFVHFSTDYVFDGRSTELYTETDQPNPIQEYGASKLAGERAVQDAKSETLLLRLSFVYGARGDTNELIGFPQWVAERLHAGDEVPLFTDQFFTPSRAGQVAEMTLSLVDSGSSGLFHVASQSCVTPYDFGAQICDLLGQDDALLDSSSMDDFDRKAERPRHSCLSVSKIEDGLDHPQPTLEGDLEALTEAFTAYSS